MADANEIVGILEIVTPIVGVLIKLAEELGGTGEAKKAAVSTAIADTYIALQATGKVKELNNVPYEAVAPLLVPATSGLIDIIVAVVKKIGSIFKPKTA